MVRGTEDSPGEKAISFVCPIDILKARYEPLNEGTVGDRELPLEEWWANRLPIPV